MTSWQKRKKISIISYTREFNQFI
uniref:Uncharacterized protein n=1 Tax=Arundo donax TaxID=35708 RepID=A0A0A9HD89_ARUDO